MFAYGQTPQRRSRTAWACSLVLHITGAAGLAIFGGSILAPPAHRTGATLVFIPPPPVEQAPAPLPKLKLKTFRIPRLPEPVHSAAQKTSLLDAPAIQPAPVASARPLPAIQTAPPPPPPPPQIRTGVLDSPQQAAAPPARHAPVVHTGAFAQNLPDEPRPAARLKTQAAGFDTQKWQNEPKERAVLTAQPAGFGGVATTRNLQNEPKRVASTGAFGSAAATPGARPASSVVVSAAGFGAASTAVPGRTRTEPLAARAGFGDAVAAKPTANAPAPPAAKTSDATPVDIMSKPRPAYTGEARKLQIEGEVVIQVVFTATGHVEIVRIISGLGHGLNETAMAAARAIRFKPATRNGDPVDSPATVRMNFELAY